MQGSPLPVWDRPPATVRSRLSGHPVRPWRLAAIARVPFASSAVAVTFSVPMGSAGGTGLVGRIEPASRRASSPPWTPNVSPCRLRQSRSTSPHTCIMGCQCRIFDWMRIRWRVPFCRVNRRFVGEGDIGSDAVRAIGTCADLDVVDRLATDARNSHRMRPLCVTITDAASSTEVDRLCYDVGSRAPARGELSQV